MKLNIIDPIGQAIERTGRMLFRGAAVGQWFVLGFSAWLARIAEGGGGGVFQWGFNGLGAADPSGGEGRRWLVENRQTLTLVALVGVTVGLAIYLALLWLRCRFKFIFLDNVVRNRTDIAENWANFKPHGNALFGFYLVLTLVTVAAALLAAGAGVGLAWEDIRGERFGPAAIAGLAVGGGLVGLVALTYALANRLTVDFVVPIMYRRGLGPVRGWGVFREQVVRGRLVSIALYVLMNWLLGMVGGMLGSLLICATCCLGALPYLSSVLLLPVIVFFRTYPLYVLGQLGPDFTLLATRTTPPPIPPSGA